MELQDTRFLPLTKVDPALLETLFSCGSPRRIHSGHAPFATTPDDCDCLSGVLGIVPGNARCELRPSWARATAARMPQERAETCPRGAPCNCLALCGLEWMFSGWSGPEQGALRWNDSWQWMRCPHTPTISERGRIFKYRGGFRCTSLSSESFAATHSHRSQTLAAPLSMNYSHCAQETVRFARVCIYG